MGEFQTYLPIYAVVLAVILSVGETLILIRTDKYWPLSIDDYLACSLLIFSALIFESAVGVALMLCAWAFMSGNLYAMLFTRLDPQTGTRERIPALSILLGAVSIGLVATFATLISRMVSA
ncbi:hypothetical protein PsAD46_02553 [Pseudovibrio sp. Ad46]|uniref:hypothetical protein n=1 Tax=unclassified Pseudovibrio TaxID=2627060 RepID=UPI0007AE56CA|nr:MULTISPECIES: hypothetical protein [unclassified Pseudovibrio]KZK88595.1 hypothetical protein PsAD46_02553 [Pseudovibrio sp. Ad46]KZK91183.1 hypothetical protein PsAD5_04321 [Pseudovibrio sp. Ad5]